MPKKRKFNPNITPQEKYHTDPLLKEINYVGSHLCMNPHKSYNNEYSSIKMRTTSGYGNPNIIQKNNKK